MENTNNTTKQYKDMTNQEKAQAIFHKLLHDQSTTKLPELILALSQEYGDEEATIYTVDDWLEDFSQYGGDITKLVTVAQNSANLNINDEYIRESMLYTRYRTSDNILDLVGEDEVTDWITSALNDKGPWVDNFDEYMKNY